MRAVNLIPVDERSGAGAQSRSGGAVYVGLGALAAAVLGVVVYVLGANGIADRKDQLVRLNQQSTQLQAQAARLAPYQQYAQLETARIATVRSLASGRFRWHQVMGDLAQVVPPGVSLTTFSGSTSGTGTGSGTATASSASSTTAASGPALTLGGCAPSQDRVATLVPRLRLVTGVTDVELSSSHGPAAGAGKQTQTAGGQSAGSAASAGAAGAGTCPSGESYAFQLVLSFVKPGAAGAATTASPTATAVPGAR